MSDTFETRGCIMPGLWAVGVLFIALKLSGHVTWSWIWVTAPFWVGPAAGLTITLLYLLAMFAFVGFALLLASVLAVMDQAKTGFHK